MLPTLQGAYYHISYDHLRYFNLRKKIVHESLVFLNILQMRHRLPF